MTPRMLLAAVERRKQLEERENYRAGIVAAAAMNAAGKKADGSAWSWKDFFGGEEEEPDDDALFTKWLDIRDRLNARKKAG